MLSDDKAGLLRAFLGGLPGDIAAKLARAVEVDKLLDGKTLPHETILDGLRPVLRQSESGDRVPTPLRLFCRAFEDILTSAPRTKKQKASIARASIRPIWAWVGGSLAPELVQAFIADVKTLVPMQKMDEANQRAAEFWSAVGEKMQAALSNDAARAKARIALGGDIVLADAGEAALLLMAGAHVLKIQAVLPKQVPHLNEDLLWQLREIYDELAANNADAAPYVAIMAMNRLARPWEALKLPMMISRQTNDTLISKTDMGLVGEILFSRIDDLQSAIMTTRHPTFESETLLQQVSSFAEMSSAIVKEIELKRDGEWGQRLLKDRAAVGTVMDGFMDRAPRELTAALPKQKGPGPKMADFSKAVGPEKQALAMHYVKLVVGSRNFAAAASFGAKQKTNYEELCNYLRYHNEDLVKELRGGEFQRKTVAEAQLPFCIELTTLLFSDEEAELLRRRCKAASAAA